MAVNDTAEGDATCATLTLPFAPVTLIAILALGLLAPATTAHAATGALTQLPGTDGCVSQDGSGGLCTDGSALNGALALAASKDGKSIYVASFSSSAVAVFARNKNRKAGPLGALTQLAGADACVNDDGSDGCTVGIGVENPFAIAVAEDGKNVYVAGSTSDAVASFARTKNKKQGAVGALTQLEGTAACVSEDGTSGLCEDGVALDRPTGVMIPRDGKHVYVAADDSESVVILARNKKQRDGPVGGLEQLAGQDGCVSEDGTGDECVDGKGLLSGIGMVTSPDGKFVYVASFGGTIAVFSRNKKTGVLTQLTGTDGCVSRDGSGGDCVDGRGLNGVRSLAMSKDGRHLYGASELANAVAVFSRDKKTGVLTQLTGTNGCIHETGADGCADGKALLGPRGIAITKDGKTVYAASVSSHAVAIFARDKGSGALTQLAGADGCVSEDGTSGDCVDGVGLQGANSVLVSNDGKNVYVAAGSSNAVTSFSRATK